MLPLYIVSWQTLYIALLVHAFHNTRETYRYLLSACMYRVAAWRSAAVIRPIGVLRASSTMAECPSDILKNTSPENGGKPVTCIFLAIWGPPPYARQHKWPS